MNNSLKVLVGGAGVITLGCLITFGGTLEALIAAVILVSALVVVTIAFRNARASEGPATRRGSLSVHGSEAEFGSHVLPMLADALSRFGYVLGSQADRVAFFTRKRSPWYFWLGYVLFFPAGLLLLLARPTQTLSVTWATESPTSTNLVLAGPDRRLDRITQLTAQRLSPGAAATESSVGLPSPQSPAPAPAGRSFCRACGERLGAADAFCGGCGAPQ